MSASASKAVVAAAAAVTERVARALHEAMAEAVADDADVVIAHLSGEGRMVPAARLRRGRALGRPRRRSV